MLSETAIIDMMHLVAPILPGLLVAAALAAQFSAAVADTSGSGGLFEELTQGRISTRAADTNNSAGNSAACRILRKELIPLLLNRNTIMANNDVQQ